MKQFLDIKELVYEIATNFPLSEDGIDDLTLKISSEYRISKRKHKFEIGGFNDFDRGAMK